MGRNWNMYRVQIFGVCYDESGTDVASERETVVAVRFLVNARGLQLNVWVSL